MMELGHFCASDAGLQARVLHGSDESFSSTLLDRFANHLKASNSRWPVQATKAASGKRFAEGAGRNGSAPGSVIGADGRLLSLGPLSTASDPGLTQAALDAVRLWTYEPTLLNGQPVEVVTTISVTFRLQ